MSKRDEERARKKKQRRQKRLKKRAPRDSVPLDDFLPPALATPPPATWPGAADPVVERPDHVKGAVGEFVFLRKPGPEKLRRVETGLRRGLLGFLPDLRDWAMEVAMYHGLPGDPWHPIDAFLAAHPEWSPAAREQILRWKQARIGLFQLGDVRDDTVGMRAWDPIKEACVGDPFRAVSLCIGGVNVYRDLRGQISLGYVAPWAPERGLFCAMGFGPILPQEGAGLVVHYLGLNHLDVVLSPPPWGTGREAMREWRAREWHAWLAERLEFPFWAAVNMPPDGRPELRQIPSLLPSTPEQARNFGIYFTVESRGWLDRRGFAAGATNVMPVDVASRNFAALREYHVYREQAGPPPGTANQPPYLEIG